MIITLENNASCLSLILAFTVLIFFFFIISGETSDVVKIRGQKDDVDKCYKHLSKTIKEMNEKSYTLEVPIYKQFHKCIIGRGGSNVKKVITFSLELIPYWIGSNLKEQILYKYII